MKRKNGISPKLNIGLCAAVLLCVVMILGLFAGCAAETAPVETDAQSITSETAEPTPSDEEVPEEAPMDENEKTGFSMTMLDVGQGLALLIEADGHFMLYDGGRPNQRR